MQDRVLKRCFFGSLARVLCKLLPVRRRLWIFGADYGNMYREGSKYLLEYMINHHAEYRCLFVTRTKSVLHELKSKHIPCVHNYSFKGIWLIAQAECVFTTQVASDILFAFKRKGRRYFYLMHGMPMKVALSMLNKKNEEHCKSRMRLWERVKCYLSRMLICDYSILDSEFVSATSDFFKYWMELEFDHKTPVKVLGMPRNDALFQSWRMNSEKWVENIEGKFVITYMPTHRKYGLGTLSPTPFENNREAQKWLEDNNAVLIVKNHPNMLRLFTKGYRPYESSVIRDITAKGIDPMTALYKSDVIISDYSSVWMDFLLLRRPMVFYIYDNFTTDDVGVYYDIKTENIGHFCYSEGGLFELIKRIKSNYDEMRPAKSVVKKFHKYIDGCSCERYFFAVSKEVVGND